MSVYVIGPDRGPFKVGISGDVERRRKALQTSHYERLTIHLTVDVTNARVLEADFHEAFSNHRLSGEWFDMPLEAIVDALQDGFERAKTPARASTPMQAKDFKRWQIDAGLNGREAADALGKSEDTISRYRTQGVPASESPVVRLACAAIISKLPPWYAK